MGGDLLSEGEQNRLIQAHMNMVPAIAADYRGVKGIPFEDLVSEGMIALVQAARAWKPNAKFWTFATYRVRGAILDFIDNWQEFVPLEADLPGGEEKIYEWQNFQFALYERWETLPCTPEEIVDRCRDLNYYRDSLIPAAFMSLGARERRIVDAFMRGQNSQQVARDNRTSYRNALLIFDRAAKKIGEIINAIETRGTASPAKPTSGNSPSPRRAGAAIA